jgi:alpha-galactosidase
MMNRLIASELETPLSAEGFPTTSEWARAAAVTFSTDWRGEHADPQRETQARLLWSHEYLFIRFVCRYRGIYVFEDSNSRRDGLWERDVAEIFVRPPQDALRHYREFEISPNGDWLDLDIDHGQKRILFCSMKSRVAIDPDACVWSADLALPINCLSTKFDPGDVWKLNLFRIEGREPTRFYSAWQPTHTPQPNFHIPEAFGELHFKTR